MVAEIFLMGVGGVANLHGRGLPGILIRYRGEYIIFDCGEGFQVEYFKHSLGANRVIRIFITHLHGDHLFGLPPFLQTLALQGRSKPLEIYGPPGLGDFLEESLEHSGRGFEVIFNVLREGQVLRTEEYMIEAVRALHSDDSYSFIFKQKDLPGVFDVERAKLLGIPEGPQRKLLQRGEVIRVGDRLIRPEEVLGPPRRGLKISYSGDTSLNPGFIEASRGSDVLIHEATYIRDDREIAVEHGHSTAEDAATAARDSGSKILLLVHFSPRYRKLGHILEEARATFRRAYLAKKGMRVSLRRYQVGLEAYFQS